MRKHRARSDAGKIVLPIEIDIDMVDMLTKLRLLDPNLADDREAIGRAVHAFHDLMLRVTKQERDLW